jgi:signal transduction histidine kinase
MGLKNIRNRVKLLEGRFTLNSSPGAGSRITITLPIP